MSHAYPVATQEDRMKIQISLDDNETRAVWEAAQKAKAEVEAWPAWKRGDDKASHPLMPREDEIDSIISLLNYVRKTHASDSSAREWLERVVQHVVGR